VVDLEAVREAEWSYLRERRKRMRQSARLEQNPPVGLALSGGGIRSATTNLGILQALSELGLLCRVDYLSTVSGGGFIGSAMSSLLAIDRGGRFSTEWESFPFNPEYRRDGLDGAAQVDHLTSHTDYLVRRQRLLHRDVLRAVGAVIGDASAMCTCTRRLATGPATQRRRYGTTRTYRCRRWPEGAPRRRRTRQPHRTTST
jgi:hypothetical protein